MSASVFVLYLLNFLLVGALPRLFFRKDGKFNLLWWATAAPFFLSALLLIACFFNFLTPAAYKYIDRRSLEVVSVFFSFASIGLIFYTIGSHRIPLALWHQQNDSPREIVTHGPYRFIRHPFYASFILILAGNTALCPHPAVLLVFIYGTMILNYTAAVEERKLCASAYGAEYKSYMLRTGRFIPKLTRTPK